MNSTLSSQPGASALTFKIASEQWEFEQIHRLNYQTFVEEIPQHSPNDKASLVDRFHEQNTYFIAIRDRRVVGMLALRTQRPFSLDSKVTNLDQYLDAKRRPCEVRLLATKIDSRNGFVFRGLVNLLIDHAVKYGFDMAVISGTPRQAKLYQHLGFVPFGPLVGQGDATYQPMYLTLDVMRQNGKAFESLQLKDVQRWSEPLNFLPGPVNVHQDVQMAFARPAVSHRSPAFLRDFQVMSRLLCKLANSEYVHVMMGSGTLANDAIAAEISRWQSPGLVLSNGAFGDRLVDHATRFGLRFRIVRCPWGEGFDWDAIQSMIDADSTIRWMWSVHGETSTGVLNDLSRLKAIAANHNLRLALDAVSSLGTTPVDLDGVALASGVSGKGLGCYPGLSFAFRNGDPPTTTPTLPRYLDLGFYADQGGVPFTVSTNLVYALQAALMRFDTKRRFPQIQLLSNRLRDGCRELGLTVLTAPEVFPAVTTIVLPSDCSSVNFGERMERAGFLIHYRSEYLQSRNWLQVCLMSECTESAIDELIAAMRRHLY